MMSVMVVSVMMSMVVDIDDEYDGGDGGGYDGVTVSWGCCCCRAR